MVVIVVTVYMSIAVRNNMHLVLYHYCCEGRYSVNIHLKCLEKSRNLIMTGEWLPSKGCRKPRLVRMFPRARVTGVPISSSNGQRSVLLQCSV